MRELYAGRLTEAHVSVHARRIEVFFWVTADLPRPSNRSMLIVY